jgi:hypothetical protein
LVRVKIETQVKVAEKVVSSLLERIAFRSQLKAMSGYYQKQIAESITWYISIIITSILVREAPHLSPESIQA